MYINSWGYGGVGVAGHHPLGAMIHVSEIEREKREFSHRCREGIETQETIRHRRDRRQSGDKNGAAVEIQQRIQRMKREGYRSPGEMR